MTAANPKHDQDLITEIVRRLVATYDPQRVYLFGSRARGDYRESSDYDLMVLVTDDHPVLSMRKPPQPLSRMGIRNDVKVYGLTRFTEQLHLKASMPSAVLRDGKLLYSNNGALQDESESRRWYVREPIPPEQDEVRIANTLDWLKRAKHDLHGAELFIEHSDEEFNEAKFHCQQAVEKSLKGFLVWHDRVPKKIHELVSLIDECMDLDPSLESILQSAHELTPWVILGRYPHKEGDPTRAEANDAMSLAREVYGAILDRIPDQLRQKLTAKSGD